MPHFNLHYFLNSLGALRGSDVFMLQVGAMDGKTFDPIHEYVNRFGWGGLLVEPIEEFYKQLCATYAANPNMRFANVAIADHTGKTTMHRVAAQHIDNNEVPKWARGVSSIYNNRNALDFEAIRPYVVQQKVACTTLPDLLSQYEVATIDLLQIDTEGYDYRVLKQLDFEKYHPLVIHMEIVNLPPEEQAACKQLLDKQGYLHAKMGYDLLAISPRLYRVC